MVLFTVVKTTMKLAATKSVNLNVFLCIVCEVSKSDHLSLKGWCFTHFIHGLVTLTFTQCFIVYLKIKLFYVLMLLYILNGGTKSTDWPVWCCFLQ